MNELAEKIRALDAERETALRRCQKAVHAIGNESNVVSVGTENLKIESFYINRRLKVYNGNKLFLLIIDRKLPARLFMLFWEQPLGQTDRNEAAEFKTEYLSKGVFSQMVCW